jgi:long-subunit acyl-CoA synthetase (AMP-forming)
LPPSLPTGTPGILWFKTATPFEYFNDSAKTADVRTKDGSMSTVGYVDADGFLYLTDRATFMIVSGRVNIYPVGFQTGRCFRAEMQIDTAVSVHLHRILMERIQPRTVQRVFDEGPGPTDCT